MRSQGIIIKFAALLVLVFSSIPVYADQAAWISRAEAARAMKVLAESTAIKHYCAPCNDKSITDESIENIGIFRIEGQNYWEIRVNGKGIDLAYVYFLKKGKWVNAAKQAKIDVSDVPKKLSRENLGN